MAEERKRGFFSRIFGGESAPEPAETSPPEAETDDAHAPAANEALARAPASPHGERMADGLLVPDLPVPAAVTDAAPGAVEQLRTDSVVAPPPSGPAANGILQEPATAQSWF